MDATALFRDGLLDGRVVALGGGAPFGPSLAALGATTVVLPPDADEDAVGETAAAAVQVHGALGALVHDLRPAFGAGGHGGLRAALDDAWTAVRAVAAAAWIGPGRAGRVALVAPAPVGESAAAAAPDPHVEAVRGAVENLARTLSIEWSRHGIRTVAITPGVSTTDGELAALAAYLVSSGGDYLSGARLALGEAPAPSAR